VLKNNAFETDLFSSGKIKKSSLSWKNVGWKGKLLPLVTEVPQFICKNK
jgi:hypothetical protein